jgi:hypothetical protein
MKNIQNRIDQSVHLLTENTPVKNSNHCIPSFPISTAEKLKAALVKRLSAEYAEVGPRLVYQAVNEANALASLTIVPLLVLPALAEEKVQKAAAWSAHQRSVLRSDSVAFAA